MGVLCALAVSQDGDQQNHQGRMHSDDLYAPLSLRASKCYMRGLYTELSYYWFRVLLRYSFTAITRVEKKNCVAVSELRFVHTRPSSLGKHAKNTAGFVSPLVQGIVPELYQHSKRMSNNGLKPPKTAQEAIVLHSCGVNFGVQVDLTLSPQPQIQSPSARSRWRRRPSGETCT